MARVAWAKILNSNLRLALVNSGQELYLECDWSKGGKGYVLYGVRPRGRDGSWPSTPGATRRNIFPRT